MTPHDAASRAAEAILEVLSGPIDECSRSLAHHDFDNARWHLQEAVDRLRRIRRDMREEGSVDTVTPSESPTG